jgi:hypothetical protein
MTPKTDKDVEWHYIHIPGLGDAWVGWGITKNQTVMDKHGKPFEAFLIGMAENGIASIRPHPNTTDYPNQHILYAKVAGYMYRAPCVITRSKDDEPCFFLKTTQPDRKANKSLR